MVTKQKAEMIALLLIVVAGGWLRLGWVGVSSFGFDEARVSDLALQMARDGRFAALGMQSSTGIPNFPAAVWLYALPYALSTNPLLANGLAGALNTLAIVGMWWLGRVAWGRAAGLTAALLFAGSPYLVFYSRSIWSQNFLAPLAVLWAVAIVAGLQSRNGRWLALHAFLAGFVGQVHIAGFALALASLWLGLRFRLWHWWAAITAGLALAGVAALPTILLLWRSGDGAKAILRQLLQEGAVADTNPLRAGQQLLQLSLNQGWERFWLNGDWLWPPALAGGLRLAGLLVGVLAVVGLIRVGGRLLKELPHAWRDLAVPPTAVTIVSALVPAWALATPLLFFSPRTPVYPQYQLASLPAVLLLAGAAASWPRKGWPAVVVGTAVFALMVQSVAIAQTLTTVSTQLVPGGMGTPLRYPLTAVAHLTADNKPIVVETFGDMAEFDGDAAVFKTLLWAYPARVVDARHVLLLPDEPAHLLFTFADLAAWEVVTAVGPQGTIHELPRRQNEPPYLALTIEEVNLRGFTELAEPIQLANGATLEGWQIQERPFTNQLRLITHWRITNPPQTGHFQQFNHLYLTGAETPHEIQDISTSSHAWQPGDHLITWVDFAPPETAPAFFHVGMYTWPDLQRSPILNRVGIDPLVPIQLPASE